MFFYFFLLTAFAGLLCYYAYKKMRGPIYWPGEVSKQAVENPEAFDSPSLVESSTAQVWRMPGNISVHHGSTSNTGISRAHILCVHGGPATVPVFPWRVCNESLFAGVKFHWFHERGCGLSSRPFDKFPTPSFWPGYKEIEEALGIGAQIADIERARRRIGVDRIGLLGHSFGGFIATLYAAEFPENVSSLVLLTPASMLRMPHRDGFDLFSSIREELKTEAAKVDFDRYIKRYLAFNKLPSMNEREAAQLHAGFGEFFRKACPGMFYPPEYGGDAIGGWAAYATYLSLGMEYDYRPALQKRLKRAKFRTIVVNGKDDLVPTSEGRLYAKLFPAELVECVTMNGGHLLADEKPVELAEIISGVLKSGEES